MCFCHKDTNYCLIVAVLPNFSQFRPQNLSARHKKSQLAFANRPFLLVFQNARSVKASCRQQNPFPSALILQTSAYPIGAKKDTSRTTKTLSDISYLWLTHYLILIQRPIGTIFRLKKYRPRLQALQTMPLSFLYIQDWSSRVHIYSFNYSEAIWIRSSVAPCFRKSI